MNFQVSAYIASAIFTVCLLPTFAFAADKEKDKAPAVGTSAPDFSLKTLSGEEVKLSKLTKDGPVVLVVLRGYPGYQCPACTAQVGQFVTSAKKFAEAKAKVVLVYPGANKELEKRGEEFLRGKTLPDNFYFVLDPDFSFTAAYHLRWDAAGETAYPSTYIVGQDGKVTFAKTSMTHGDRASADEVLKALKK